uniref:THAP domain-containing protein 1 n=1 Tax=Nothobranchius furzeri TaxID=105023 RepID=A0A8C6LM82_NOTFU
MVDSCCAPGCQNRRGQVKGRSFYRIPKDPERRKRWIITMKRSSLQAKMKLWDPESKGFRLCSDHFISGTKINVSSTVNAMAENMRRLHPRLASTSINMSSQEWI